MSCRRWVVSWKTYLWNFAIIIGRHSRGIFQCEASRSVINAWIRHQVFVDNQLLLVFKNRRRSSIKVELYLKICLDWGSIVSKGHTSIKFEQSEFLSNILNNFFPFSLWRMIEIPLSFVQPTLISVRSMNEHLHSPFNLLLWCLLEVFLVFRRCWIIIFKIIVSSLDHGNSLKHRIRVIVIDLQQLKMCPISRYLFHSLNCIFEN